MSARPYLYLVTDEHPPSIGLVPAPLPELRRDITVIRRERRQARRWLRWWWVFGAPGYLAALLWLGSLWTRVMAVWP